MMPAFWATKAFILGILICPNVLYLLSATKPRTLLKFAGFPSGYQELGIEPSSATNSENSRYYAMLLLSLDCGDVLYICEA